MSKYANTVYDQLWVKEGSPENIEILDLDLECFGPFRDLVYGHRENAKFDGAHLAGAAGPRQFTYHLIKSMKAKKLSKMSRDAQVDNHFSCPNAGVRHKYQRKQENTANYGDNQSQRSSRECDQSQDRYVRPQSYSEAVSSNTGHSARYSVPTQNRFDQLNY